MRGWGGGKMLRGGGMPERVKKTKCGGGGLRNKNWGGGYAGKGKEDEMRGGGCGNNLKVGVCREGTEDKMQGGGVAEKNWGGIPERVKETHCAGWVGWCCEKNFKGYAGEG